MPHVEIKYSADLKIDVGSLFDVIEDTINELDSSAGACKSRAYIAENYKYTHVMIEIWLLPKLHRNQVFTETLLQAIQNRIKEKVVSCYVSLQLYYRDTNYLTIE